jgi:hypothetical protein
MATFDSGLASRHAAALQGINSRTCLPYLGIDCAEAPDGRPLFFEVDNAMIVQATDAEDMYPNKQPAMRKVFNVFRAMLEIARRRPLPG